MTAAPFRTVDLAVVRERYLVPPTLTFDGGRFCSVDACKAPLTATAVGWTCTKCPARWDSKGLHGWWADGMRLLGSDVTPRRSGRRFGRRVVLAGFAAGALSLISGMVAAPHLPRLPIGLVLTIAAVLAGSGLLLLIGARLAGLVSDARLAARNTLHGTCAGLGLPEDPAAAAAAWTAREQGGEVIR